MTPTQMQGAEIDIGALSTPFTPMTAEEAAEVARDLYGLEGDLKRFATEKDDTFRLRTPTGAYVLKIANPGESAEELDLQIKVLRHIERTDPGLPVPRIFADRAGNDQPVILDRTGAARRVRLMSFLDGTLLDTIAPLEEELPVIGRMCARLRLAMAGFAHPGAQRVVAWDVRQLPGLGTLLADVKDPGQKAMLEAGYARYMDLFPRIDALPRQVVHNDFSRSNLLVDRSGPASLVGIIDFGDTVETAIAIDLSTALLNQLPRDAAENPVEDLLAAPRAVLHGYLEVAPLTDEERALLPHLVMGRVIARALITLWRAREFPDNETYILRNTEQGWAQLDWFLARDPDDISALLA